MSLGAWPPDPAAAPAAAPATAPSSRSLSEIWLPAKAPNTPPITAPACCLPPGASQLVMPLADWALAIPGTADIATRAAPAIKALLIIFDMTHSFSGVVS